MLIQWRFTRLNSCPRRIELDGQGDDGEGHSQEREADRAYQDIENPFQDTLYV